MIWQRLQMDTNTEWLWNRAHNWLYYSNVHIESLNKLWNYFQGSIYRPIFDDY
jgi:hypothetical protein